MEAADRTIQDQAEWLRITLASIGDAVIATDAAGRVTFMNGVAEALTGWDQAAAAGRPLVDVFRIVNEHTREPVENPALRALRDGAVVGLANHTALLARDGSERLIDDSAAPVRADDGTVAGAVLVFRDVTERRRADEARARLAAIVASSDDAIVAKSLDGTILAWNAGAERLFGYAPDEAIGRPITLIIPPELLDEERAILDRLRRGERVEHFETVRVAKDGRRIDISLTVSPVRNAAGQVVGASKVARDVTERKRADAALRESEARHRVLADLAAATQPLTDPAAIMAASARLLAEHLGVDRCAYAEVEGEADFVITGDHPVGVASIVGRWPVAAFGAECTRLMLANEPYVVEDADADPRITPADLPAYRATDIRAVICVPLHKAGRFTAAMAVHQKVARRWTPAEIRLVTTVVGRCWEALERAAAERALAASRARLDYAVRAAGIGFWYCDLPFDVLAWDDRVKAHFWLPPDAAVTIETFYDRIHPDDREPTRSAIERSIADRAQYDVQYRTIDPASGAARWVRALGGAAYGPDGRPARFDGVTIDVTEQRRVAEEAARAAEANAKFRTLFEQGAQFAGLLTLDGTVVEANRLCLDACGFTRKDVIGRPFWECGWWDRSPQLMDLVRAGCAQAAEGRLFRVETAYFVADGTERFVDLTVAPVTDDAGRVLFLNPTGTDVTDRRRAEDELRDIRSRMEAALAAGAIGTWSWDVPADRFFGDPSLARIFSLDPEAVAGAPIALLLDAIHPDDRDRVADLVGQVSATGERYEADYRVAQRDGSWRWVTARGQVERDADGRAVRFPGVVIDVTERKRAEDALARVTAESERRKRLYETALSNTPDLVYVFDLEHRFIYANEALLNMWGKTWDEAIGRTCLELGYEGWHASMHDQEIEQVRATKGPIRGEVPFTGTAGRRVYDYIFVPVFGATGDVEAVAGTTRDVTDRQAMEQQLRDADRKKDDFIALLAHELRNPLAPIRNGLQVLRLARADAASSARAREMMDRQLAHLVRLVDDLLDVSRINRSKMELRRARVALADVVASAVETARPLIDEAGHELTLALPQRPVLLDADLTRLAQVFSNLLTNSAKYTPPGGRIWLAAERRAGQVVVTVRDDGIGIPAAALPNIFDMFSQVDRPIERSAGGLGIGLALVKGLVEMHGGTVAAASAGEGQGSTFTVVLPVVESADPAAAVVARPAGATRRILVVDDNRDGADSLAMMLRLLGNEVETAHDGLEAVERAEAFRPEVVLMDVGMPRLNGLDATRRIRAEPWGGAMTIIALTGWGQDGDRERSRDAGCDGHLVKPVELADLERMLARPRGG